MDHHVGSALRDADVELPVLLSGANLIRFPLERPAEPLAADAELDGLPRSVEVVNGNGKLVGGHARTG